MFLPYLCIATGIIFWITGVVLKCLGLSVPVNSFLLIGVGVLFSGCGLYWITRVGDMLEKDFQKILRNLPPYEEVMNKEGNIGEDFFVIRATEIPLGKVLKIIIKIKGSSATVTKYALIGRNGKILTNFSIENLYEFGSPVDPAENLED